MDLPLGRACMRVLATSKGYTTAVLKHPPSAPASAAPKGDNFTGLDWTDMEDQEDQEVVKEEGQQTFEIGRAHV